MNDSQVKIGIKALLISAGIIAGLMLVAGILTLVLPAGEYQRVLDAGRTLVVPGTYAEIPKPDYPFWRWLTAPIEVLFAPGNITLITISLFIICVGGSISILEKAGVMENLIHRLVVNFGKRKYLLMAVLIAFFMMVSSFLGIYEGMVPMIIFIIPLALSLGWDSLTGLGMSLLPLAFGFASAVTNPFTLVPAQKIADLPPFSGYGLRLVFLLCTFSLVFTFVYRHARKVEKNPLASLSFKEDEELRKRLSGGKVYEPGQDTHLRRAFTFFAICIGIALSLVFLATNVPVLANLSFPVMGLMFLVGGIGGGLFARLGPGGVARAFGQGSLNLLPGVVLILMAYSVQYIIVQGRIMDTILHGMSLLIASASPMGAAFLIYGITLVMNFFIGSASAKAFLMMPLLVPLADMAGITRQTAVLAFDFGDGFSNMIFPTNALLLIALSFSVVSYTKWMKWTFALQGLVLLITSAFLAFAVFIKFGPF